MKNLRRLLFLGIFLLSTASLQGCVTKKLELFPITSKDRCEFTGEDICFPAPGYTAFSDGYLEQVMQIKINNKK